MEKKELAYTEMTVQLVSRIQAVLKRNKKETFMKLFNNEFKVNIVVKQIFKLLTGKSIGKSKAINW